MLEVIYVLEAEDTREAEIEGEPCWFPTSVRDGDDLIDASGNPSALRIPQQDGYRFRLARYRRIEENMGNWNITIRGVGAHHNKDYPADANVMTAAFVKALREAGHTVIAASFTYGCEEDLTNVGKEAPAGDGG